jgi:REP element-mobilizing transposase RayT
MSLFKEEKAVTRARNQLISLDATSYYHCISRYVRRAFLLGEDSLTGKNYEHRKKWVISRLRELAGVFSIDICAYAVMSNHYHLALRVDRIIESWHERLSDISRFMRSPNEHPARRANEEDNYTGLLKEGKFWMGAPVYLPISSLPP